MRVGVQVRVRARARVSGRKGWHQGWKLRLASRCLVVAVHLAVVVGDAVGQPHLGLDMQGEGSFGVRLVVRVPGAWIQPWVQVGIQPWAQAWS